MEDKKITGYKGFGNGMVCRDKQYAENTDFEEDYAQICEKGMHFCALPHQVFSYYPPVFGNEFAEVEAPEGAESGGNGKYCTKKLHVGRKVGVQELCRISVPAFFKAFQLKEKIAGIPKDAPSNVGDSDAANAGTWGAANAGAWGAANAGDHGAANAGYSGAANAGDLGAANAGDHGAANAGAWGAANAGDLGAANAGNYGAAIVRSGGSASAGYGGVAVAFGKDARAKGKKGAALVFVWEEEDGLSKAVVKMVDGEKVKEDVFYQIRNGRCVRSKEDRE